MSAFRAIKLTQEYMVGWLFRKWVENIRQLLKFQEPESGKNADTYTASKGFITLNIFIHGILLTMPDSMYDILKSSALYQYNLYGIDSADRYYRSMDSDDLKIKNKLRHIMM